MKNDYLVHWYEPDTYVDIWYDYEDADYDSMLEDWGIFEKELQVGEQCFERLWNITEKEVIEFVEKQKKERGVTKIWFETI